MTVDPRDYDLGELRDGVRPDDEDGGDDAASAARGRADSTRAERTRTPPGDPGTSEAVDRLRSGSRERLGDATRGTGSQWGTDAPEGGGGPSVRRVEGLDEPAPGPDRAVGRPLYRELSVLERATDGPIERPYLDRVPAAYDADLAVMEWLDALLATAGRESTRAAIEYYRRLDWITPRVERTLQAHVDALAERHADSHLELQWDDHRVSLAYVARLAVIERGNGPPGRRPR